MAPIEDLEPQPQGTQGLCEEVHRVVSSAGMNQSIRDAQKFQEFITEFQDVFAKKSGDCVGTEFTIASTPAMLVRSVFFADSCWPRNLKFNKLQKYMVERGANEESESSWSSSC
jgi:hypothetical protein